MKITKIKLLNYYKDCEKLLRELNNLLNNEEHPKIFRTNHCNICEFKESCFTELLEKDDLSLLGRMSQKEIIKQNNKGIFTINQFSYTFKSRKRSKNKDKALPYNFALKALAIREKQTYIYEVPKFPNVKTEIFFDFESLPEENFIYLIGIVIIDGVNVLQKSLWANSINDETEIFKRLFQIVSEYKSYAVFHYGSYDIETLKSFNIKSNRQYETTINDIIEKSVNVLSFFYSNVYPPTYTNELKDITKFLNFKWSDTIASGIQSIVWRKKWELNDDNIFKNKLIQYNIEDCYALKLVKNWLLSFETKYNNTSLNFKRQFCRIPIVL